MCSWFGLLILLIHYPSCLVQAIALPGQVVCRYTAFTSNTVNYYTCQELSDRYNIGVDEFFKLNPAVANTCDNVQVNFEYCVRGC
jgi:hypothetical protein